MTPTGQPKIQILLVFFVCIIWRSKLEAETKELAGQTHRSREYKGGLQGLRGKGNGETAHQDQVSFWRNENTLELDSSDGHTTGDDTKNLY